ncbi:hypothetical protein KLP28_16280 [Nocardioidaceae bacterium]|nr:hypothetical protein KLP28_16280 [Nocardioidaceae bacterium]
MTPGPRADETTPRRHVRRGAAVVGALGLVAAMIGWSTARSEPSTGIAPAVDSAVSTAVTTVAVGRFDATYAGLVTPLTTERASRAAGPRSVPAGAGGALGTPQVGVGTTSAVAPAETPSPVSAIEGDLRDALQRADRRERLPRGLAEQGSVLRDDARPLPARCTAEPGESRHQVCAVGDRASDRTAVLIGSSHVMMWLPGLRDQAERAGVRLLVYVKYGCAPYTFTMRRGYVPWTECMQWRDWAIDDAVAQRPELVIAGSHAWVDISSPSGSALTGSSFDDAWRGGVSGLVTRLAPVTDAGGRVTVVGDTTRRTLDPGRCAESRRGNYGRCEQRITLDTVHLNDLTREAAEGAGGDYYDPGELVCLDARCPVASGGRFVFRDRLGHVSATYARHVGAALAERVGLMR